ncbi:MAG TPA: DarT ssDNA thymidine ADP-ribosyltransferase family protein [Noviherbaspirillum sp.]
MRAILFLPQNCHVGKQAEFLIEHSSSWHVIDRIGVQNNITYREAINALPTGGHRPVVEVLPAWYY